MTRRPVVAPPPDDRCLCRRSGGGCSGFPSRSGWVPKGRHRSAHHPGREHLGRRPRRTATVSAAGELAHRTQTPARSAEAMCPGRRGGSEADLSAQHWRVRQCVVGPLVLTLRLEGHSRTLGSLPAQPGANDALSAVRRGEHPCECALDGALRLAQAVLSERTIAFGDSDRDAGQPHAGGDVDAEEPRGDVSGQAQVLLFTGEASVAYAPPSVPAGGPSPPPLLTQNVLARRNSLPVIVRVRSALHTAQRGRRPVEHSRRLTDGERPRTKRRPVHLKQAQAVEAADRGRHPDRRTLDPRRAAPHLLLAGRTQRRHRRTARMAQCAGVVPANRTAAS